MYSENKKSINIRRRFSVMQILSVSLSRKRHQRKEDFMHTLFPERWLSRIILTCLAMLGVQTLCAQQEDSLHIRRDSVVSALPTNDTTATLPLGTLSVEKRTVGMPPISKEMELRKGLYLPYHTNPSPSHYGDYSIIGTLAPLGDGYLFGAGQQTSVPGIGRFNAAALGYMVQVDDRLRLQFAIDALKANTAYFTSQAFGASGMLLYQAQDRLYFRAFAGSNFGNFQVPPAFVLGGTVGFAFTDRFGMEVGAEGFYNPATRRWEASPIVMPYYKFDHFKMQVDVGGILYWVLRNVLDKDSGRRFSPTIRPDVPGFRH